MNQRKARRIIYFSALALFAGLYLQMRTISSDEKECMRTVSGGDRTLDSLYQGANLTFLSAGNCDHCHGLDPAGIASVDLEGGDINLTDDWSSTMMANSAKDPFWRAKVSHEVFTNPALQVEIEGTCTRCHAPLGRFAGLMNGEPDYSIEAMLADSVALDGVSCLACHRQAPQPEVALHTGQLTFSPELVAYGQYLSPLISPMAAATNYIPTQSDHISDSKLCAGCHSLVTETVDLSGNLTGGDFVEQATWHEWLNSSYPASNTTCQSCHLPKLNGQSVVLAAGIPAPGRPDFALHTLAGGNTLMLGILSANRELLGIYASTAQFDETISATMNNLQANSLQLEVLNEVRTADTLYFDVKLKNITGHKLPSGYPARRMSVHVGVKDVAQNVLFASGGFDENYAIPVEDSPMEPHYDVISSEEEVQIYEMVIGDVNNNRTSVLLRGAAHLKDNRLVPIGFTQSSNVYDTTEVVLGITDNNFNHDPNEGSGSDIIHYKIPMNDYYDVASVEIKVYYQSLPPVWLEEIFQVSTPEIETFTTMFNAADKSPVLMKSASLSVAPYIGVNEESKVNMVRVIKDMSGRIRFSNSASVTLDLYDMSGRKIFGRRYSPGQYDLNTQIASGTYIAVFSNELGKTQVEKFVIE